MCRWLVPNLLAVTLLAGCGGGQWSAAPEVAGGTTAQRQLLGAVLRAMPPTAVERIELQGETLEVGWASRRSVRSRWEGLVIAGAFRDRLVVQGLPEVNWLAVPDGGVNISRHVGPVDDSGPGLLALGRVAIATLVARALGASVEQLRIYAPFGHAVVLVLSIDDPASFLRHSFRSVSRWLEESALDGYYVLVEGGSGDRVFELAWAQRLGGFMSWVRPDLAGCSPVVPFSAVPSAARPAPPPCPATGS